MLIKRYTEADIPKTIELCEQALANSQFSDIYFSYEKMEDRLRSNLRNSQFFLNLAFDNDEVVGGLCASVYPFIFSYDVIAKDEIFYVIPNKRSLRVATALVAGYVEWAKLRKVKRIQLANSMGGNVEGFSKLATKLGFELVGTIHQMRF